MRRARALLPLIAALTAGCAGLWLPARLPDCSGPLPDAAALPRGDFALREELRVTGPGVELALELAAERRGDRLVLVGFDPLGARLFHVVQQGEESEAESRLGRALPIAPLDVLLDLHAARLASGAGDTPVEVQRPGCAHRSHFVQLDRQPLPPSHD